MKETSPSVELRALEPEDLDFLYRFENDPEIWKYSENQRPLSKNRLKKYLDHAHLDPFKIGQLRLVVTVAGESVGLVDLFDFNPKHGNAMIGIVIDPLHRNKGIGVKAVISMCDYAQSWLNCRQLAAMISESNSHSIRLFEKAGFQKSGVMHDWIATPSGFETQLWYQKKLE